MSKYITMHGQQTLKKYCIYFL